MILIPYQNSSNPLPLSPSPLLPLSPSPPPLSNITDNIEALQLT
jgi:hypothetical protein